MITKIITQKGPHYELFHLVRLEVEVEKALMGKENSISSGPAKVLEMSPRIPIAFLASYHTYRMVNDTTVNLSKSFKRTQLHVTYFSNVFSVLQKILNHEKPDLYFRTVRCKIIKKERLEKIGAQIANFIFLEYKIANNPDRRNHVVSNAKN